MGKEEIVMVITKAGWGLTLIAICAVLGSTEGLPTGLHDQPTHTQAMAAASEVPKPAATGSLAKVKEASSLTQASIESAEAQVAEGKSVVKKAKHLIQNNNKDLMAQAKQMLAAGDKLGDDAQQKLAVSAAAGSVAAKEVIAQTGSQPAHSKEEATAETKDVGESDQEDEDEDQEEAVGESDDADDQDRQDDNDEAENEDVGNDDDEEDDGTNKAEDEDEDDDIGDDDEEDDNDDAETENNDDEDDDDDDELGETTGETTELGTPQDAIKRDSQWDTKAFGAANGTQWPKGQKGKKMI